MENTQLPIAEDDVFSSPDTASKSPSYRIHFPSNDANSNRLSRTRADTQKGLSGLTPPVRRGSPLNPQNVNQIADPWRRPWPPDLPLSTTDSSSRHRRNPSLGLGGIARPDSTSRYSNAVPDGELEMGVFSDEYDLSHEDPRILQDVQRALKMKARREARLKRETLATPEKPASNSPSASPRSEMPSKPASSMPLPVKPSPSPSLPLPSNRKLSTASSEVDFSPATGAFDFTVHAHPVPSSTDNGRTLEWTGTVSDDADKRWTISIGKRKDKDKLPPLGVMMGMMDEQDQIYKAKLSDISSTASPQTLRKAGITSNQLGRRYGLIYDAVESKEDPLNLAKIARWHDAQPEAARNALEKAEPFTWLKHLEKRTGKTSRSRWNISALTMEQYLLALNNRDRMQTIPEDSAVQDSAVSFPRKSRSPSFLSSSRGGIGPPLASSLSMGLTADDRVSFGPFAESKRDSLDAVSRKSAESALSSIRSGSSKAGMPISPMSSRTNDGDTRNSRNYGLTDRPRSPGSSTSDSSSSSSKGQMSPNSLLVPGVSIHPPSSERLLIDESNAVPLTLTTSRGSSDSSQKKFIVSPASQSVTSSKSSLKPRKVRMSLPPTDRIRRRSKRHQENREEQLRREYETKATLLHEANAHNHRIRQFLNRISTGLRDYDALQHTSGKVPGANQRSIPKDVLDSFSHDPSAVTGATRRLRGWRAVEDINQRVYRQRATLRAFLDSVTEDPPSKGCLLDEPIEHVLQALAEIEVHKDEIADGAESVENLLETVQREHALVKDNYNKTVSHVSTVYPELSHIVALEESYKDQYQQFWDLGMDALTLLLDTVTPFWRTYGKTIGEDVRDFLIIPLYRNEFTGEAKTYPINDFPRRSPRHWFGLGIFFLVSVAVNVLQVRAAITSTLNCRLQLIPYDGVRWTALPFFWVGIIIQWLAVVFEFAIVFMQLGVITWWTGWSVKLLT